MKKWSAVLALAAILISCSKVSEKAGETIDSGAQKVGKTATDIVNSIDKGISQSTALDIELSDQLKRSGLSSGKYYVRENTAGRENTVSLYLISNRDFKGTLHARLFDKKGVEMGRIEKDFTQRKGQAAYCDFVFDDKIDIESQGKLSID
jgi:hypothetical protein